SRRDDERLVGAPEPEEAPRLGAVARPGEQAAGVELAVAGIEPATHHAGRQIGDRQREHPSLEDASRGVARIGHWLGEDQMDAALAVGKLEEMAPERRPGVGRHAEELRGG
ncbi:MAG: hypothetical protein ACK55I_15490, partial [bacterium]